MIENPNVICNECGFCKQNKILKQQLAIAVDYISELNKKFEIFLVSDKKRTMKEVEDALFDYEMLLLKAYGFACNTKINEELNK